MKLDIRHSGLRKILVAGAASVGLLLSACDSAMLIDPNATDNTTVTDPISSDAVDLIATAEAAGSFTTLIAAIEAANLRDQLADENNIYTVFAPTDSAFEALGAEAVTALLADSAALNDTLLYHVLAGSNDASAVTALAGSTVTMLNGKDAAVSMEVDQLRINLSTITTADIVASNGVIHIIDTVLSPPADAPAPADNLAQLVSNDPQFTTLVSALQVTGLDATLSGDGPFTIFAPNEAAFEALGEETVNALIADPDTLRDVLLNHVVEGQAIDSAAATAAAGTEITSAAATPLAVSLNGDALMINNATVVRTDIAGTNGVIHEIDAVIQVPEVTTDSNTIMDALTANADYSALVSLIQTAGLTETLKDVDSNFTVFAPNNAAITAADTALQAGFTSDPAALAGLLLGHVHGATLTSADVAALNGTDLAMANGSAKAITAVEGVVTIGSATVIDADMQAQNGVIHGIDSVLLD